MEEFKIDWSALENIEYKSGLEKSLKNTLHRFDKDELYMELLDMIAYYTSLPEDFIPYDSRVKSIQSCDIKYLKYYPNTPVEKAFNDILGIRITVSSYSVFDALEIPNDVARIADMRNGKANDDGYRGIHLYYQKSHFHYPIEIQFVTEKDKFFNMMLHDYLYKYVSDSTIGIELRQIYDAGGIVSEEDFKKELKNVLSDREKI